MKRSFRLGYSFAENRSGMFGLALFALSVSPGFAAAPASFTLLAPDSSWTNAHAPVFTWQASGGAITYEIWIDGIQTATGIKQTNYIPTKPLADGLHSWFVKASGDGSARPSADTGWFTIGNPPVHFWDYTDGFERGDLNNYIGNGLGVDKNGIAGTYSAYHMSAEANVMHYAYNPLLSNTQEAEASILFSLDNPNASVGVGFADKDGTWCYAFVNRALNALRIERRASYSIFPHTQTGFTRSNWTEWQEKGFYIWCADTVKLPSALTQGTAYRLKFDLSNRLPSMGKCAMAVIEKTDGTNIATVRTILDDVFTPHPLFIIKDGSARIDDFRFQLLDRWSYNWKPYPKPLNPSWSGFNPAVWRDNNKKWWMTSRTDNKIRWSTDGINWSLQTANAPPVSIMDPAVLGVQGNPWNDGRTYLASCDGCCFAPVQIFYTTDPASGNWTKWNEHAGLPDCGREHVFVDTKDWPTLSPIAYNGTNYRFLSILEGDVGKGGSTMIKLTNDQVNYVKIECADLYGNATNKALEEKNLWMMECLNSATSCAMALDGDIRVMMFKDGMRYEKAMPQEAILDGKQPWKVKALQTIPGFPYYWGDWHKVRDKAGASWYGGKYQWPSCFVWVPEEKKAFCYWGEENTINLSTAYVIPEFTIASLSIDSSTTVVKGQMRVTANLWNFGDAEGDDTVNLLVDGTKIDTKYLHLAANTDSTIAFTLTPLAAGVHTISVGNRSVAVSASGTAIISQGSTPPAAFRAENRYRIKLFDLRGRCVLNVNTDFSDLRAISLPGNHGRGIYFAQVSEGPRVVKSGKIIIGK
jgi:hypothetical protein